MAHTVEDLLKTYEAQLGALRQAQFDQLFELLALIHKEKIPEMLPEIATLYAHMAGGGSFDTFELYAVPPADLDGVIQRVPSVLDFLRQSSRDPLGLLEGANLRALPSDIKNGNDFDETQDSLDVDELLESYELGDVQGLKPWVIKNLKKGPISGKLVLCLSTIYPMIKGGYQYFYNSEERSHAIKAGRLGFSGNVNYLSPDHALSFLAKARRANKLKSFEEV